MFLIIKNKFQFLNLYSIFILFLSLLFLPIINIAYAGTVDLPQTGQTTCYDESGSVIASCSGTGQDGEILAGIAWPSQRFTDNSNGTITDNLTGLIWLKDAKCFGTNGQKTWSTAISSTTGLADGSCGLTDDSAAGDWRLPNVNELESLINAEESNSTTWLKNQGFTDVQASIYWSGSTYANATSQAWYVNIGSGFVNYYSKTNSTYVWPVRSGGSSGSADIWKTGQTASYDTGDDGDLQKGVAWPSPRFTDNGDDTATDNLTGLVWLKDANCISTNYSSFDTDGTTGDGRVTWQNSLNFVTGINDGTYTNCGGSYTDWRLPNRKERHSLTDYSQNGPALPSGHPFTNVLTSFYWSGSTYASSPGSAWYVWMNNGSMSYTVKSVLNYVWPVRSGQIGSLGYLGVSVSPDPYDFGNVNYDSVSALKTFTLSNAGVANMGIGTVSVTGTDSSAVSIQNEDCSDKTMIVSGACNIQVLFSSTTLGAKSAYLSIPAQDPYKNPINVPLSGTIVDITEPSVTITSHSDGSSLQRLIEIIGTASDPGSGISQVDLKITNGIYYVNSSLQLTSTETWATASGTDSWIFNASSINLTDGNWTITARATDGSGNTNDTFITLTIAAGQQAYTTLSLDLSSQTIMQNDTLDAVGKLTRLPEDTNVSLANLTINLDITAPDGSQTPGTTNTYDSLGHYEFTALSGFTQKGTYTLQASFDATSILTASSSTKSILVGASAGYAVIVQGKIANEEGLNSHNKTTNRIYNKLKERGFIDDNIFYFNYDTTQASVTVDEIPSKSGVQSAIETWASGKMNGSPAPLYIIMIDHGNIDTFYINNETITPTELASWLDTLESGLNSGALSEKRIIIYGACYSGSFIPALSKSGRVIISSAAADEESYKGPNEPDNIRSGEFFMEEFFKELGWGFSFKDSFVKATEKTEKFTRKGGGSANTANIYFDSAMQHPLLDDNSDRAGSNVLSEGQGDGQTAKDLYLGTGVTYDTNSVANPVEINETTETIYLNTSTSSALMWAATNDDSQVDSAVWMEIRPPSKTLAAAGGTNQLSTDYTKEFMTLNESASRWEDTYSSFTESGMYEIFYFARDIETKELSPTKRSVVYKNKTSNNTPVAFGLVSPENGLEQKTVLIFDWEESSDPDGDTITYNLVIGTDSNFSSIVYKKEEITTSMTYIDDSAALSDLTAYYWKVQAVDAYGALTDSTQTRSFNTNNTNGFPAIITGTIYNSYNFSPVVGASLSTNLGDVAISIGGGVYIMIAFPGTMNITSSYGGYFDASVSGVVAESGDTAIVNIPMSPVLMSEIDSPATSISPAEGTYTSGQTVTLTCSDGDGSGCAATYYTTDGSNPTTSSTQYSSAIPVATSTTIKYFSADSAGNKEKMKKADYFIIPAGTATLSVSPTSLAFGSSTTEMNISISNTGGGSMEWSAASDKAWLTIKNSNGLTEGITDQRVVSANRSGLSAGDYTGTITIDAGSTGSDTISVTMAVSNLPVLSYAPPQIDFGHLRTQASLNITNKGTGTLNWSVSTTSSWLTFDVSSGSTTTENAQVTMTIDRDVMSTGESTGTVDISDGTTTVNIPVTAYKPDSAVSFTSMTTDPSNMDADGSSTSLITATFSSTCTSVTFSTELGSFGTATSTATNGVATATYTASSVEGIAVIMAECNGVYGAGTVNLNNISFTNAETEIPGTGATTVDKRSTTGLSMEKSGFGTPPVTLATYSFNPGSTFSNVPIGNYFDANLGDTDDVDSVTIKKWVTAEDLSGISVFEKMTLGLYYANGTSWEACSDTGYIASASGSYSGYIYATFTDSTIPSIDYLDGLPLVASEEAVIPVPTLSEWGMILLSILLLSCGIWVSGKRRGISFF